MYHCNQHLTGITNFLPLVAEGVTKALKAYNCGELYANMEYEIEYHGPPCCENGKPKGCAGVFEQINLTQHEVMDATNKSSLFIQFQEERGRLSDEDQELRNLIHLLAGAFKCPE